MAECLGNRSFGAISGAPGCPERAEIIRTERTLRGGIGVMLDDVMAGLLAAGVVGVLAALGAFAS